MNQDLASIAAVIGFLAMFAIAIAIIGPFVMWIAAHLSRTLGV